MLYVGKWDRYKIVQKYIEENKINKVLVIYNPRTYTDFESWDGIDQHEYLEYSQTIMYKNYYRLLQWIDKNTLVICRDLLITSNRHQLEYNCIVNYLNQTSHRMVFSYFPFINNERDFMILLDQHNPAIYKGKQIADIDISEFSKDINPVHLDLNFIDIQISDSDTVHYNVEKEKLFNNIGNKDPDTIPNNLALVAGKIRSKYLDKSGEYTARNMRLKNLSCISTYKEDKLNTILDFPLKRQDFISLLQITGKTRIDAVTSDLSIDRLNRTDYTDWINRLEDFYAKAKVL